jgi:hypothetical protein
MNSREYQLKIPAFKGLYMGSDETNINPEYSPNAQNIDVSNNTLKSAYGIEKYNPSLPQWVTPTNILSIKGDVIGDYYRFTEPLITNKDGGISKSLDSSAYSIPSIETNREHKFDYILNLSNAEFRYPLTGSFVTQIITLGTGTVSKVYLGFNIQGNFINTTSKMKFHVYLRRVNDSVIVGEATYDFEFLADTFTEFNGLSIDVTENVYEGDNTELYLVVNAYDSDATNSWTLDGCKIYIGLNYFSFNPIGSGEVLYLTTDKFDVCEGLPSYESNLKYLKDTTLENCNYFNQDNISWYTIPTSTKSSGMTTVYLTDYGNKEHILFANGKIYVNEYSMGTVLFSRSLLNSFLKISGTSTIADFFTFVNVPDANKLVVSKERLWACLANENSTMVYASRPDKPFDFSAYDSTNPEDTPENAGFAVNLYQDKGGQIVDMIAFQDDIIVFRESAIVRIDSSPGFANQIDAIESIEGIIIGGTVVSDGSFVFFLTTKGLMVYNGVNVSKVDINMENFWSSLNQSYIKNSRAYIYDNKVFLAVPEGTSTINNTIVIYDLNLKGYTLMRDINAIAFTVYQDKLLYAGYDGYIYKLDKALSPATAFWETPETDLTYPELVKTIKNVTLYGKGKIKIDVTFDGITKSYLYDLGDTFAYKRLPLMGRGRRVSFKISNVNGSSFEIKSNIIFNFDMDKYEGWGR